MHNTQGDIRGKQAVLFWYALPTKGAKTMTLPRNPDILIFAASADGRHNTQPLTALFDRLDRRPCDFSRTPAEDKTQEITPFQRKRGRADFLMNYISRRLKREKDML